MRIGLYFGSFNPVHTGHLIIANHVLNQTNIDRIWFVISPQNPFKVGHELLPEQERLKLVQKTIEHDERMIASDIEFKLSKPSYTINTLNHLKENFPKEEFSIIMGSDSFQSIDKWKESKEIIGSNSFFIYRRPGFEIADTKNDKIKILDAPLLELSSTAIRQLIKNGKSIRYLVPEIVREEIEKNNFYK